MARQVKSSIGPVADSASAPPARRGASEATLRRLEVALWVFAASLWALFFLILAR